MISNASCSRCSQKLTARSIVVAVLCLAVVPLRLRATSTQARVVYVEPQEIWVRLMQPVDLRSGELVRIVRATTSVEAIVEETSQTGLLLIPISVDNANDQLEIGATIAIEHSVDRTPAAERTDGATRQTEWSFLTGYDFSRWPICSYCNDEERAQFKQTLDDQSDRFSLGLGLNHRFGGSQRILNQTKIGFRNENADTTSTETIENALQIDYRYHHPLHELAISLSQRTSVGLDREANDDSLLAHDLSSTYLFGDSQHLLHLLIEERLTSEEYLLDQSDAVFRDRLKNRIGVGVSFRPNSLNRIDLLATYEANRFRHHHPESDYQEPGVAVRIDQSSSLGNGYAEASGGLRSYGGTVAGDTSDQVDDQWIAQGLSEFEPDRGRVGITLQHQWDLTYKRFAEAEDFQSRILTNWIRPELRGRVGSDVDLFIAYEGVLGLDLDTALMDDGFNEHGAIIGLDAILEGGFIAGLSVNWLRRRFNDPFPHSSTDLFIDADTITDRDHRSWIVSLLLDGAISNRVSADLLLDWENRKDLIPAGETSNQLFGNVSFSYRF